MKICIYGAGAIGGLLGGRLAAGGNDVTLIARGANLAAIRADGLRVDDRGEVFQAHPRCTDSSNDAGPQDYVILTMKAHGVAAAARGIAPLLGPDTAVVTMQNGLPWWYFQDAEGALGGRVPQSVDPGGVITEAIGMERVIGAVANAATSVPEPGSVRCIGGGMFTLGEPGGGQAERCRRLVDTIGKSGLVGKFTEDIRGEIWAKLWGNVSFSALAVLTGAPLAPLVGEPAIRRMARRIMEETQAVAEALGVRFPITIDQRMETSAGMGAHKTSILQDLEAGRPMEVDAMIGSVIEAGRIAGVETPLTDMIYALVRQRAIEAGLYPDNPAFRAVLETG